MANSKTPAALAQPQPISPNLPTTQADWQQFASTLQQWLDRSAVLWKPIQNCVIGDETITKQRGVSAWDSGASTISGYQTCHVSFSANDLVGRFMVGISQNPILPTLTFIGLDFAMYCNVGTLFYSEGGSAISLGVPYAAGDLLSVAYDASTVTYYQNNTVLRTVSIAGKTYYGTAAFFDPGAACNSLQFLPGPVIT